MRKHTVASTLTVRLSESDKALMDWAKEHTGERRATRAIIAGLRQLQRQADREAYLNQRAAGRTEAYRDAQRTIAEIYRAASKLHSSMGGTAWQWDKEDGGQLTID